MSGKEKQPYVRYRIEAEVRDKGLSFSIDRAIQSYVKAQGYEASLHNEKRNSNNYSTILSVFDNFQEIGRYLNIEDLLNHITNSGRMPTDKNKHPEIKINPLPYSEVIISEVDKNQDNIAWEKTVESLNNEIKNLNEKYTTHISERDGTIESLTNALSSRQKTISEKDSELKSLRNKVKENLPKTYADPLSAILYGYIEHYQDEFLELSSDLEILVNQGDVETYKSNYEKNCGDFLSYYKTKLNCDIKNEDDLKKIFDEVKKYGSWEETHEGSNNEIKDAIAYREAIDKDEKIIEKMKKEGASSSLINVIKLNIESRNSELKTLEERVKGKKEFFNRTREVVKALGDMGPEEVYKNFQEVDERSHLRRTRRLRMPIVFSHNMEHDWVIDLYLPSIDGKSHYENHLQQTLKEIVTKTNSNYELISHERGDDITRFSIKNSKESTFSEKKVLEIMDIIKKNLEEDNLNHKLGIRFNPLFLR